MICEEIILSKSKEVKTGSNLAQSSKAGYDLKRAVLSAMMMIFQIISSSQKSNGLCGEFEVLTTVVTKSSIFWHPLKVSGRFGRSCHLSRPEAETCSPETLIEFQRTARRYNTGD
jgi:hypothetical protein